MIMLRRDATRTCAVLAACGSLLIAAAVPAAAAAAPVAAAATCTGPVGGAATCRVAFAAIGKAQRWTVPDGVTRITVLLAGASAVADATYPDSPGRGGLVRGSLPVTPASVLVVAIGQQGRSGGTVYGGGNDGGGGGSFLFRDRTLAVAAGGGGSAGLLFGPPDSGFARSPHGGDGGAGNAGRDGTSAPGTGATTTAPGYCPERTRPVCTDGTGPTRTWLRIATGGGGGGGGGGGYFAGGGNVSDGTDDGGIVGPGGGGSGYLAPDVVVTGADTNVGAGRIVITYQLPAA